MFLSNYNQIFLGGDFTFLGGDFTSLGGDFYISWW